MKDNEEDMEECRAVRISGRGGQDSSQGLPIISIEYMFIGDQQAKEEEKDMPALVTKNMTHEPDSGEKTRGRGRWQLQG